MKPVRSILLSGLLLGLLAAGGCSQDDRAAATGDRVRALAGVRSADITVVQATVAQPGIRVQPELGLDGAALLALARGIRAVVVDEKYGATASLTFQRPDLNAEAQISSVSDAPDDALAGRLDAWLLVAETVRVTNPEARTVLGHELGVQPGPELSITGGDALTDLPEVIALSGRLEPLLADQPLSWRFGSATAGIVLPASDVVLSTSVALRVAPDEPVPPRDAVTVSSWGAAFASYVDLRLRALAEVVGDRTVSVQISRGSDFADPLAQWTSTGDPPESFSRARTPYQNGWLADRARALFG